MFRFLFTIVFTILIIVGFSQKEETLFIFTDTTLKNVILDDFSKNYLPKIEKKAHDLNVKTRIIYQDSLLQSLHMLPAIYYTNNHHQKLFKSRYNAIGKLEAFIKTQQSFSLQSVPLEKHRIFFRTINGVDIGIVLKVFPLTGKDIETTQEEFEEETFEALSQGFKKYQLKNKHSFSDQSRLYYLNIYPWYTPEEGYFLGAELFSQFNCIMPIWSRLEQKIIGNTIDDVFYQLAEAVELKMPTLMQDTSNADGFIAINHSSTLNWEDLGVTPTIQNKKWKMNDAFPTKRKWEYRSSEIGSPVKFTFMPPVSQYSGVIDDLAGWFLYENMLLQGEFRVSIAGLTMGEESLDHSVMQQLLVTKFPQASIYFNQAVNITYNEAFKIKAMLNFLGKERPIDCSVKFLPLNDESESILVEVETTLNIAGDASIEKPDGPSPQNETILILSNFKAKPVN